MKGAWFLLFCVGFFVVGCASQGPAREREAISRGIYATHDAIAANRFDLAKKYNDETTRLVAPPKKRITIESFSTKEKSIKTKINGKVTKTTKLPRNYVVLPEGINKEDIVIAQSDEYNQLIKENNELKAKEKINEKNIQEYKNEMDRAIRARDEELARLRAQPSFLSRVWSVIKGIFKFGIPGLIIILVALFILSFFFPALLPIFNGIIGVIGAIFGWILRLIKRLFGG